MLKKFSFASLDQRGAISYAPFWFFVVVVGVALLYTLIHSKVPLLGNDAAAVIAVQASGQPFSFEKIVNDAFGQFTGRDYVPLAEVIRNFGAFYFAEQWCPPWVWLFGVGMLFGFFAWIFYRLGVSFLRTRGFAFLAVVLVMCSALFLQEWWSVFSFVVILAPLVLVAGLWSYLRILGSDDSKPFSSVGWYGWLVFILFLAPYASAFAVFLPVMILLYELIVRRRWGMSALFAAVGFLHAFFPTAAMKFIAFSELPVEPLYHFGIFHQAWTGFQSFNFSAWDEVCVRVFTFLPGLIYLLVFAAVIAAVQANGQSRKAFVEGRSLRILIWLLACSLVPVVILTPSNPDRLSLMSGLLPLTLLAVYLIERFYFEYEIFKKTYGVFVLQMIAFVCIGITLLDQALNVFNSLRVVRGVEHGIETTAVWFENNVPAGSVVITHAAQAADLAAAGSHVQVNSLSTTEAALFIDQIPDGKKVYVLEIEPTVSESSLYLQAAGLPAGVSQDIHSVRVLSAYLDPFKMFGSQRDSLIPGEWVDDFYAGSVHHKFSPFVREVSAIYKVTEIDVHAWKDSLASHDHSHEVKASVEPTMPQEQAVAIAMESEEAKSFYAVNQGQLSQCVTPKALKPCDSDWVTCIDDAWVIEFVAGEECGIEHDGRVSLRLLIGKDGKIISRFPEKEYFQNHEYCLEDYDCLGMAEGEKILCGNFFYAQLAGVNADAVCGCVEQRCSLKEGGGE